MKKIALKVSPIFATTSFRLNKIRMLKRSTKETYVYELRHVFFNNKQCFPISLSRPSLLLQFEWTNESKTWNFLLHNPNKEMHD